MDKNEELDNAVNSIITQLKQTPEVSEKLKVAFPEISNETLEDFVIAHAGKLIKSATDSVEYVQDIVTSAPTPDDIAALAQLITSTSSALDVLNKIILTKKKLDHATKIKEMDIKSKAEAIEQKPTAVVLASRKEIMDKLFNDAKVIDAEFIINDKQS